MLNELQKVDQTAINRDETFCFLGISENNNVQFYFWSGSSEAPKFKTISGHGQMEVIDIPDSRLDMFRAINVHKESF